MPMQGTTPYLPWRINRDLTGYQTILLTISQRGRGFNFWTDRHTILETAEGSTIGVIHLTQEETLALKPGACRVQITWIDSAGERHATKVIELESLESLYKEVIA